MVIRVVGGDQAFLDDGQGFPPGPGRLEKAGFLDRAGDVFRAVLERRAADRRRQVLRAGGVHAREAEDLDDLGEMDEGPAAFRAPGRLEGAEALREAPEVDPASGGGVVGVHDGLQETEARHLVEDQEEVASEGAARRNRVGGRELR